MTVTLFRNVRDMLCHPCFISELIVYRTQSNNYIIALNLAQIFYSLVAMNVEFITQILRFL